MTRHPNLGELLWPDETEETQLAVDWAASVSVQVLDWVWRGFDAVKDRLKGLDLSQGIEQLERSLTQLHFLQIQLLWARETAGFSSVHPMHEMPEFETTSSASAKPPAYDLGFVHLQNQRWKWPIEAKVLPTPQAHAAYLKDVRGKFVEAIAAPLVGEGAMIGYLLSGAPGAFFDKLAECLNQTLQNVPEFRLRSHRTSTHERVGAPTLQLHHLLLELSGTAVG